MAYWLDEAWHRWLEVDEIGTAAAGLYARCGSYIADEKTDGFIPTARARMYGTPEWIGRLVEVGLWSVEEKGFRDVRYLELNATRADIEQRKADAAKRQKRWRDRQSSSPKKSARKSRGSNALRDASLTAPPSPPSPNGEGKGGAGGRHAPDLDPMSRHCRTCDKPEANAIHIRSVGGRSA
jgi:hypothetical protein